MSDTPKNTDSADFGAQLRALAKEFGMTPSQLGAEILRADDSKRVADAAIAAIEEVKTAMICRHDAMCQHMTNDHFHAVQQANPKPRY